MSGYPMEKAIVKVLCGIGATAGHNSITVKECAIVIIIITTIP
jgi:hypothetical protein